ncbi:MAG: iron-sulfur cluster assembly scaffold protein [Pseudomonadota bacterium]|nr:iron-sulfur cluster assembly scaffold protein [Pseudomonadota bacterium]|tara:strand:+ start:11994 stop:12398 length:405 start_codon:yes stop_codon:yes gene_type:complete
MAYSKKVVDKFEKTLKEPEKNSVGRWDPNQQDIGTGMVGAPACGDVMRLQIKCELEKNKHVIRDVKFKTYGCGSAIASSSELVDMLKGRTLEEAKAIKNKDIAKALDLPPIKIHCSVLAEDSIKQAIQDFESKL